MIFLRNSARFVIWCGAVLLANICLCRASIAQQIEPIHVQDVDRAIIFVHGLEGDAVTTFKANKSSKSWGQLMKEDTVQMFIAPSLSNFSIYSVDYSDVFDANISIVSISKQVSETIIVNGLFRKYNRIWFITHSLGGLLIKKMLIDYSLQRKSKYLDRIVGVFLMAVPSQGSPLAELAEIDVLRVISYLFGKNIRIVEDLKPASVSSYLDSLEKQWVSFLIQRREGSRKIPVVYCGYEEETLFFVKVVSQLYASTRCSEEPMPFTRDHSTIVKPEDESDFVYLWVRERIDHSGRIAKNEPLVKWNGPRNEPLVRLIKRFNKRRKGKWIEESTGLPEVSEEINFQAEDKNVYDRFFVVGENFEAASVADLFERIAGTEGNDCISLKISENRREIDLAIKGKTQTCSNGGNPIYMCGAANCR